MLSLLNNFSLGVIYWWVLENPSGVKAANQGQGLCVQGKEICVPFVGTRDLCVQEQGNSCVPSAGTGGFVFLL